MKRLEKRRSEGEREREGREEREGDKEKESGRRGRIPGQERGKGRSGRLRGGGVGVRWYWFLSRDERDWWKRRREVSEEKPKGMEREVQATKV